MAEIHKKGDGKETTNGDIPVVAPLNMGKGIKWNADSKKYEIVIAKGHPLKINDNNEIEVKLDPDNSNMIQFRPNGLYYGVEPEEEYRYQYVDFINGDDGNDGSKARPLKYVSTALNNIKPGTKGSEIFLKENQDHFIFKDRNLWRQYINASVRISPYGDKYDELNALWHSDHTGKSTPEPLAGSQEFKSYRPRLVIRQSERDYGFDKSLNYNETFSVEGGSELEFVGIDIVSRLDSRSENSGWYNAFVRGSNGVVVFRGVEIDNQTRANNKHLYLATSTAGGIEVRMYYFNVKSDINPIFRVNPNKLDLNIHATSTGEVKPLSQGGMHYITATPLATLKTLVRNGNALNPMWNE